MFKKKSRLVLLSIFLILAVTLSACGAGGDNGNNGDNGNGDSEGSVESVKDPETDELVVAQGAHPASLDPHQSNDQPSSRVNTQIYDSLVGATVDMELEPGLAESWEALDDTTWQFNIREGVQFHNGEELTASDVKFSLDRMLESPEVAHIVEAIESVEVEDDYTVIINLAEPFAPILAHLSHTAAAIFNETAVTEAGDNYHNEPVGTGPYAFVEQGAGDYVLLERFEDYWGDPAPIKNVRFRNIPEGTNRTIGLETGEIDIAYEIEPIDKATVSGHDNLALIEEPSLSTQYIGFNLQKEPFDDVDVRQAINHAIDVEQIIEVVLEGSGTLATGPINDGVFGYNTDLTPYEYDPDLAMELLEEAGYADGFETTIWTNDNPVRVRIAEMVQEQLRQVGITVTIEQVEWSAYLERTGLGEHDMFILGWVTVTGDADYGLYALYHSTQHGGAGNRTFFEDERVDELLEAGRTTVDEDARLESYSEAQQIIVDAAPQIFLYFDTQNVGIQNYVTEFELNPAGHHSIYSVNFQ